MSEEDIVIRASDGEMATRATVLKNCSSVLEGILNDGTAPHVISMSDATIAAVNSFVNVAMITSHETGHAVDLHEIVKVAPDIMPLVHKYDAKGVLNLVKLAVNVPITCFPYEHLTAEGALAVLKHDVDGDGDIEWMEVQTRVVLLKYFCGRCNSSVNKWWPVKRAELPQKSAQELLFWALTTAPYHVTKGQASINVDGNIWQHLRA